MKALFLTLTAVLLASCSTTSMRERRIAENPAYFATLSGTEQALVHAGKIQLGMARETVLLALGRPSRLLEGEATGGKRTETWIYQGQQPVYVDHAWDDYPVIGRCGRVSMVHTGPSYVYVPYVRARVQFTDGKVSAWESTAR